MNLFLHFQILEEQRAHPNVIIKAEDILPHPTTVSRNTQKAADMGREALATRLRTALSNPSGCVSFTTDQFTDQYKQRTYTSITAHWIEEWVLHSHVLTTHEFPEDQQKTGINIRQHLQEIFQEMGLSPELLKRAVFTTDKGSNIILALRDEERLDCINHILNRVVQHSLEPKHAPVAVLDLISAGKELVRFIKKSSLQEQLSKTLKQSQATRWNSTFTMLQSILDSYDELQQLLAIKRPSELHCLTAINKSLLKELTDFLHEFEIATKACEGEHHPTLHRVIPLMKQLEAHCESAEGDSCPLISLKDKMLTFLQDKFTPHILHKAAVFLNPLQKSMRALPLEDRQLVLNYINDRIDALPLRAHRPAPQEEAPQPPEKKRRLNINTFDDLPEDEEQLSEVELYQQHSVKGPDRQLPLLEWWKQHSTTFPALSTVAASILCIMSTSAPSERNFSIAGTVVSLRRSSLKPSSVNSLLFINSARRFSRKCPK